jgi:hypothetical protein
MMKRQGQEMASIPIPDRRESLTTPSRKIKVDSPSFLKILLKKAQKMFCQKKSKMKSDLGYRLL